jgi:hypothetical protein
LRPRSPAGRNRSTAIKIETLRQAHQEGAQDSPFDAPDPAQNGRDERFQSKLNTDIRLERDLTEIVVEKSGGARERRADNESQSDDTVGGNAHEGGRLRIEGDRADGAAGAREAHDVNQDRGQDDSGEELNDAATAHVQVDRP